MALGVQRMGFMANLIKTSAVALATPIVEVRGLRVMIDADLAAVYGVPTKGLNQAVKRNPSRFPPDFAFQLGRMEAANLKSQFVTSRSAWGGTRKLPWAFTEHGALMAAAVLNSPRATDMSVFVVRAFVRMRDTLRSHAGIARRLSAIERKVGRHDHKLHAVIAELQRLITPKRTRRRPIGFAPPPTAGTDGRASTLAMRARRR